MVNFIDINNQQWTNDVEPTLLNFAVIQYCCTELSMRDVKTVSKLLNINQRSSPSEPKKTFMGGPQDTQ